MNKQDLTEGLDARQRQELGDLRELQTRLTAYEAPEPDSAALFRRLKPVLMTEASPANRSPTGFHYWLWLAWSQISLMTGSFWWASGLLLGLGSVLCAASGGAAAAAFVLASPALAVVGVAYIFRPTARSLREMELLSAVRPLEMLYARVVLLFTYNAVFLLLLFLVAGGQGLQLGFGRLLLIWFGPMIGLTGLGLYITIRWKAAAGLAVPLVTWCMLIGLGWRETAPQVIFSIDWDTLLRVVQHSKLLEGMSLVALVAGICLLWLAGDLVQRGRLS